MFDSIIFHMKLSLNPKVNLHLNFVTFVKLQMLMWPQQQLK